MPTAALQGGSGCGNSSSTLSSTEGGGGGRRPWWGARQQASTQCQIYDQRANDTGHACGLRQEAPTTRNTPQNWCWVQRCDVVAEIAELKRQVAEGNKSVALGQKPPPLCLRGTPIDFLSRHFIHEGEGDREYSKKPGIKFALP